MWTRAATQIQSQAFVDAYGSGPQRVQLEIKHPRGFAEYLRQF